MFMEKKDNLLHPEHFKIIDSTGVIVDMDAHGFGTAIGKDRIYPYMILTLCTKGSASSLYDKVEVHTEKNSLSIIMPGHLLRPLEVSEDFRHSWLILDPEKFADSELKFNPRDLDIFSQAPIVHLTDEQATNLETVVRVINYINTRTEEELPNKHRLLEAQLTIAYELYLSIRRSYDENWEKDKRGNVYLKFCDLVVKYYKEERNVNFYAAQLGYDARYFTKIFRAYNHGTPPLEWIQNYICTQAERLLKDHPKMTVKAISLELGFPTTGHFCRYFKRATGMTPQEFRQQNAQEEQ